VADDVAVGGDDAVRELEAVGVLDDEALALAPTLRLAVSEPEVDAVTVALSEFVGVADGGAAQARRRT